ncbi:outer membrane beta-barrel protein [Fimbriimonas ginsengisoli]|uniref:Outer membrane protein beta-barrel domain-containing protein n=1 Tax=Fimbriimonas ginsengisoli Gsoil 348 TaxID=661478 RepID=A0A068NIS3_FIMGI|nr:outer membrane beta-barrel protein [Fimbriimonas ginsengisoli]AIE83372.1 hypothetical protein OP10G_0004 [Fimbriimonas ginsengisoli Gsoil 348]
MNVKPLIAVIALAAISAAHAQDQQSLGVNIGGQVGVYMPTSSAVRDAFGKSVLNLGLGPVGGTNRPSSGSLTPSLELLSANKNGNRLFIGTFTYGYEKHLAPDESTTVPYVRVFGGGAYFDYGITQVGVRNSAKKFSTTGGVEAGIVFANRLKLSAKYNVYPKQDGFDFSGFSLSATYSLFKL